MCRWVLDLRRETRWSGSTIKGVDVDASLTRVEADPYEENRAILKPNPGSMNFIKLFQIPDL